MPQVAAAARRRQRAWPSKTTPALACRTTHAEPAVTTPAWAFRRSGQILRRINASKFISDIVLTIVEPPPPPGEARVRNTREIAMAFKDIAVALFSVKDDETAFSAAEIIA